MFSPLSFFVTTYSIQEFGKLTFDFNFHFNSRTDIDGRVTGGGQKERRTTISISWNLQGRFSRVPLPSRHRKPRKLQTIPTTYVGISVVGI